MVNFEITLSQSFRLSTPVIMVESKINLHRVKPIVLAWPFTGFFWEGSVSTDALPFSVEQDHSRVVVIRMKADSPNWRQSFLLRSDAHRDNLYNVWDLEKQHLDEARRRGAGILDMGDAYCCMQGKFDKRLDYDQLRPELHVSAKRYLDSCVDYLADSYLPYAPNWCLMGLGNHEDSVLKRHQTSLHDRLAERLRAKQSQVKSGPYHGWVRFAFQFCTTHRTSYRLWYHHGYGGGGPVTRDVIQTSRQAVYLTNADFVVSGHTHDSFHVTVRRETLRDDGVPVLSDVEFLKCPGYKDDYSSGEGWSNARGAPPKPLGGHWLTFYRDNDKIRYEIQRAKE
jgi:hypothetical protein